MRDGIRTLACLAAYGAIGVSVAAFGWLAVNLAYVMTR